MHRLARNETPSTTSKNESVNSMEEAANSSVQPLAGTTFGFSKVLEQHFTMLLDDVPTKSTYDCVTERCCEQPQA